MRRHISTLPPGYSAYTNDGCRCDGCREGQRLVMQETRAAYRSRRDLYPVPHGTDNGYTNYGCRCGECKTAHAAYSRARYIRKTSTTP